MWLVLIEWDGAQPPTTYYTALHHLALRVRGDKEFDPIVRRAGEYNKAVIVQEGAVLVPSESLARQVAHLAEQEGARSVMLGNVELREDENRQLTPAELSVIHRFNQTFKKRGRPSYRESEERDWVITCPECVHTSMVTARKVIQCPRCGGLRVSARTGARVVSSRPTNFEEWKNTRFTRSVFEIPAYEQDAGIPKAEHIHSEDDAILSRLGITGWAQNTHNFDLLDTVFCARRFYSAQDRQHARVECCLKMYSKGFSQSDISIFEDSNVFEPIDAAICYMGDYEDIIEYYKTMKGEKI